MESSNMRSWGFLTGSIPSTNTCNHNSYLTVTILSAYLSVSKTFTHKISYRFFSIAFIDACHIYLVAVLDHLQNPISVILSQVVKRIESKPGRLMDVPWSSSWTWCPDPSERRNGYDVYWRYETGVGSASWRCFQYGQTPVTVMVKENIVWVGK